MQDVNDIKMAVLHVDYDDAFVAYLNGVEITRANIGTVNVPPPYNASATDFTEPIIIYGGRPNTYIIQNFKVCYRMVIMFLLFRFIITEQVLLILL